MKPPVIRHAILLQLLVVVAGMVSFILNRSWDPSNLPPETARALEQLPPLFFPVVLFSSMVFGWGLLFWLLYKVNRSRNWARITMLILFLVGLPFTIKSAVQMLSFRPVAGSVIVGELVLQGLSYVLLFSRAAKPWFQPSPPPLPPGANAGPTLNY